MVDYQSMHIGKHAEYNHWCFYDAEKTVVKMLLDDHESKHLSSFALFDVKHFDKVSGCSFLH
jgi:hypothetical protein